MANENELLVIFGADGKQLTKTIEQLEGDLKSFQKQLRGATDAGTLADLNKKLADTKAHIAAIRGFQLDKQLSAIRPSAGAASFALTDLTRIAQDLPFGFIAIQNNITPLMDSFARLKAETGSSAAAFRVLGSSLLGAGGIGVAIGAVTLGFQLYERFSKSSRQETEKLKKETEGVADAIAQEATRVSILVSAIQSEVITKRQRNSAIEELKRLNPNYFGQLKDETDLIEKLSGQYNSYIQGLVAAARSKAYEKKLADAFTKKIELELSIDPDKPSNIIQLNKSTGEQAKQEFMKAYNIKPRDADKAYSNLAMPGSVWTEHGAYAGANFNKGFVQANTFFDGKNVGSQLDKVNSEIDFFIKKIQETGATKFNPFQDKTARDSTKQSLEQLFFKINKEAGEGWQKLIEQSNTEADRYFNNLKSVLDNKAKQQQIIDAFNGTNDAIKRGIVGLEARGSTTSVIGDTRIKQIDEQAQILQRFKELGANPPDFSWLTDVGAQNMVLLDGLRQTTERMAQVGAIAQEFLAPAFKSLFDAMISGSQSAVDAITSFLKNLVKQMISTIATAAALAAVMSAFGGGSFGSLFKGFLGIKGGGGSPFSGGAGPSGLATLGATTGSSFGSYNFRIDGNDLVASVDRTRSSNGILGG
jgi:hypothetical protein